MSRGLLKNSRLYRGRSTGRIAFTGFPDVEISNNTCFSCLEEEKYEENDICDTDKENVP